MKIALVSTPGSDKEVEASWFTPELPGLRHPDGSKNREAAKPVKVLLRPIDDRRMKKIRNAAGNFTRADREVNLAERGQDVRNRMLRACVVEIVGLELDAPDGSTVEPRDADALIKALDHASPAVSEAILDELLEAIQDASKLRAGLLDKPGAS